MNEENVNNTGEHQLKGGARPSRANRIQGLQNLHQNTYHLVGAAKYHPVARPSVHGTNRRNKLPREASHANKLCSGFHFNLRSIANRAGTEQ